MFGGANVAFRHEDVQTYISYTLTSAESVSLEENHGKVMGIITVRMGYSQASYF